MTQIEALQSSPARLPPINSPHEIRLESAGPVNEWSRWSYLAGAPLLLLSCNAIDRITTLQDANGIVQQWHDPLDALQWLAQFRTDAPTPGPPFKGGWIGWISYDFGQLFEDLPSRAIDDTGLPLFEFTYHDHALALDRSTETMYRITNSSPIDSKPIKFERSLALGQGELSCNFTRQQYERAVQRAIDYIAAGDVFQVNLSQRFTAPLQESPDQIYARLHQQSGSTYGAYLGYSDHALISNSPELFLRVIPDLRNRGSTGLAEVKRQIVTRPIKGTRPRGTSMEDELRESKKDQAELNMIVDLERNDLGRVCEIGSVRVMHPREIEAHPTVYHGVATIEGTLRDDVTFLDLLRATFPGGSVTGAPKIRAMQIIDDLEPTRRGPYCGAIGFISNDGHIEFNLAIRTMIVTGGKIHIPVGGGIVADSIPAAEYEETLVKARAMRAAVGVAIS